MQHRVTLVFWGMALTALLFMNNSGGRATVAGGANTGAPGDDVSTCITCHASSASIQVGIQADVRDADGNSILSDGYQAGETYEVQVTIETQSGSPAGYGFQMISLQAPLDEAGPEAGSWSSPSANAQLGVANNGRTYAEHNGISNTNVFSVDWTAPSDGSGPVSFYFCGNGVNANGSNDGDGADCGSLQLEEAVATSTHQVIRERLQFQLAPNPAREATVAKLLAPETGRYTYHLWDAQGRLVRQQEWQLSAGEHALHIDLQDESPGMYRITIQGPRVQAVQSLVKF